MFNIKSLDRHFCAFEYISSCKSIQWGDYPFILIASTRSTYCEWKYVNVLLCTSILKHIRNKFCLIPPHIHRCCMRSEKNLLNTILKLLRKSLTTAKVFAPYVRKWLQPQNFVFCFTEILQLMERMKGDYSISFYMKFDKSYLKYIHIFMNWKRRI